jgi:hypothetical protein
MYPVISQTSSSLIVKSLSTLLVSWLTPPSTGMPKPGLFAHEQQLSSPLNCSYAANSAKYPPAKSGP